jgi:cellulose synthase/poly-beta-1,6-N-acetylglucosamine synthase-like glycosyltransferase
METELNREKKWFKRERQPYIEFAQIFIPILLLFLFVSTFMQTINNYIPVCSLFIVCVTPNVISPMEYILYFYISTFRSLCAVHNMTGLCNCSISCFRGMLLRYFVSDFEIVQVSPVMSGINFAFIYHMS